MKYKFVKLRPLTVGEEVCIDKKTLPSRRQRLCPESCKVYTKGTGSRFIEQFKMAKVVSYFDC
jgi:hypothetical protein